MATKTLVDTDSIQTMSGKTLTGPVVNAGTCGADPVLPLGVATKQYIDNLLLNIIPIGVQWPYAGATPPAGWLVCDGSAVSRTTYSALFAVLHTTYGSGDGATTFNLPDKRGRSSIGYGSGPGLTPRTRGTRFGSETEIAPVQSHIHGARAGIPTINTTGSGEIGFLYGNAAGRPDETLTVTVDPTGGSGTHANIHPVEVDLWIIKAL